MKDPNAMTVEECRDELAHNAGWVKQRTRWKHPAQNPGGSWRGIHPIPATIDEAAKLLEGWVITYIATQWVDDAWLYVAQAAYMAPGGNGKKPQSEGRDRKTCEFRLRVAVERLARQGEGGGQ